MSCRPRSKCIAKAWPPSTNWNKAAKAKREIPISTIKFALTSSEFRKAEISNLGNPKKIKIAKEDNPSDIISAAQHSLIISCLFFLPKAELTLIVAASDKPKWSMKVILASCKAIPCAANSSWPTQPIIIELAENKPASAILVIPIADPIFKTSPITPRSGLQKRTNNLCCGSFIFA